MRCFCAALVVMLVSALGWCADAKSQSPVADAPARPPCTFANTAIEAEELADFLGITVWTFSYEGGSPRCWVEVVEENQKTVSQPRIIDVKAGDTANAAGGKILLFVRPGTVELRVNSARSRGGAGVSLPQTALWWGWKGHGGSTTRLERPVALKAGQELTLLRHEIEEPRESAKDPGKPRKVKILLKAALVNEKP